MGYDATCWHSNDTCNDYVGIFQKDFKKRFFNSIGLAYTWVTNVFTMLPIYYIFYVTGQVLLGHWDDISGYNQLQDILHDTFMADLSFSEQWLLFFKLMLQDWGIAMVVGCIPWLIAGAWGGYVLTMKFERARAERKQKRLQKIRNLA